MRRLMMPSPAGMRISVPQHPVWAARPFGIDHRVPCDSNGILTRSSQKALAGATIVTVPGGSFAPGDHDKRGDSSWRSRDSTAVPSALVLGGRWIFQRARLSRADNPDMFFRGTRYQRLPDGEVTAMADAATPVIIATIAISWKYIRWNCRCLASPWRTSARGHGQSDGLTASTPGRGRRHLGRAGHCRWSRAGFHTASRSASCTASDACEDAQPAMHLCAGETRRATRSL
ncbi:MAG TPA: hypothetical protein VFK08_05170, partial [Rhodanobacteraceae bacterium]|nr:hypothetical protein [Rhodanobacteraceae bacterium]